MLVHAGLHLTAMVRRASEELSRLSVCPAARAHSRFSRTQCCTPDSDFLLQCSNLLLRLSRRDPYCRRSDPEAGSGSALREVSLRHSASVAGADRSTSRRVGRPARRPPGKLAAGPTGAFCRRRRSLLPKGGKQGNDFFDVPFLRPSVRRFDSLSSSVSSSLTRCLAPSAPSGTSFACPGSEAADKSVA